MIKFLLMSKNQETANGRKFKKFFTSMNIVVKGEEEKGKQEKTLTVKFDKEIDVSSFRRGIITANEKDVELPYKFEIREVEDKKTGEKKLKYPHIYVKAIISYEERLPKSTGEFNLKDEAETEETEISDDKLPFED